MTRFYYDKDFYSFENGYRLEDNEVQKMVDDVTKRCEESYRKDICDSYFIATGDTIVFGYVWEDEISIFVCRGYKEATAIENEYGDLKKVDYGYDYEEEEREAERATLENCDKNELIDMILDLKESVN